MMERKLISGTPVPASRRATRNRETRRESFSLSVIISTLHLGCMGCMVVPHCFGHRHTAISPFDCAYDRNAAALAAK